MRQFILGANVAYATGTDLSQVADGAVGFFYNKDGQPTVTNTGAEIKNIAMLVLGRTAEKGGPVVLPIYKNNFSYVKGVYQASTKFTADFTVSAPTEKGEYSIIVVKKGVGFNERNKWTATVYIPNTTTSANDLATKLAEAINNNTVGSGVTATPSSAKVTVTAVNKGEDYEIVGADKLMGISVNVSSKGIPAYGDAKYVIDLSNKAAADAGFEYTYQDDVNYLYPNYPLNPLKQNDSADTGFTIFTLKFSEPRTTRTVDVNINQIVQVAFPTGSASITTFETVCKALSGEADADTMSLYTLSDTSENDETENTIDEDIANLVNGK